MSQTQLNSNHDSNEFVGSGKQSTQAEFTRWVLGKPESTKHLLRRLPERDANAKGTTKKRDTEFAFGRSCAHELLKSFGESDPVEVATDRSPIWPAGFVGSISHSERWVWAAVAPNHSTWSVGIDVEAIVDVKTRTQLELEIATLDEWSIAGGLQLDPETTFTVVFSAKEAFYKCWYPQNNEFFGFEHAAIESCDANKLTIRTLERNPNFGLTPETLEVFYTVIDNHVFAASWMGERQRTDIQC